ncbi:transcriptional regulator, TetR family [Natronincola peptidivorans]|uniref:Transcriptional regulator, TetR family n=1 Tax=Natronincola peptidivorans TaxID=426128 RepID=A0A1I0AUK1_9FIRM|nr:TetR/AcrR family transcriptional regulator [Natronincola peptidivorans]SES98055.1 transcriptional regulator, TetR family [Natronincola peptidivorans]
MAKTDGDITKERILQVAEELFAEKGFDGTGVDKIAKSAGINKGSIYYHFKDKNHIIESLFEKIMDEIAEHINSASNAGEVDHNKLSLEDKIRSEIRYMDQKKKIISVLFMETLKSGNPTDSLIRCMEIIVKKELNSTLKIDKLENLSEDEFQKYMIHEFFTGIIPVISLITLKDKWCKYFNYDEDKLLEHFMEAFINTHIKSHADL